MRLEGSQFGLFARVDQSSGGAQGLVGQRHGLFGQGDPAFGGFGLGVGVGQSEGEIGLRLDQPRPCSIESRPTGGDPRAALAPDFERLAQRKGRLGIVRAAIDAAAAEVLDLHPDGGIGSSASLTSQALGLAHAGGGFGEPWGIGLRLGEKVLERRRRIGSRAASGRQRADNRDHAHGRETQLSTHDESHEDVFLEIETQTVRLLGRKGRVRL